MAVLLSRALPGLGAVLVLVLMGCGGRTGMLDSDAVEISSSQPSDAGSSGSSATHGGGTATAGSTGTTSHGGTASTIGGGSATAGGPSVGGSAPMGGSPAGGAAAAGAAGTPSAGSGGAVGSGPGPLEICKEYCDAAASGACMSGLPARGECLMGCANELTGQGNACWPLAAAMTDCMAPILATQMGRCADVEQLAIAKCQLQVEAYSRCSDPGTAPQPVPTPIPVPIPQPTPAPTCQGSGSSSLYSCNLNLKCENGSYYNVSCNQTGPNQSICMCSTSNGAAGGLELNEGIAFSCQDALSACGAPSGSN